MDSQTTHSNPPPFMVVDSSSLLTLLLAGEEHQRNYGYARLLLGLSKRGLIELRIPDMVVSEFLGLQTPIQTQYLLGKHPIVSADQVRFGYRFAAQRIGLLQELLATGHTQIVPTSCGEEYLSRLETLLSAPENHHLATRNEAWPPPRDMLVSRLCKPNTKLARAVHAHNLSETLRTPQGDIRVAVKNGCKDRGEIAIADVVRGLQQQHVGQPIFVLYEGGDVRGRIIQRLQFAVPAEDDPLYHQYGGELDDRYNPNTAGFDARTTHGIGMVNFVTTYAFLHSMMLAARDIEGVTGRARELYIVRPDEANSPSQSYDSYKVMMRRVGEKGLPRAYNRFRDCSIHAVGDEVSQKPPRTLSGTNGPWGRYITTALAAPEMRDQLHSMFSAFARYRVQQVEHQLEINVHQLFEDMALLPPQRAVVLLEHIQHDIQRLQKYMEFKLNDSDANALQDRHVRSHRHSSTHAK